VASYLDAATPSRSMATEPNRVPRLWAQRAVRLQTSTEFESPASNSLRARRRITSPSDVDSTLLDRVFSDVHYPS
jgi:hypothetical protein